VVLVPLYLRYFDLATYGAWLASGGLAAMLGLIDGGLGQVISQRLASSAGAGDDRAFASAAGTGWALSGAVSAAMIVVGVALAPIVPGWVNAPVAQEQALSVAFAFAAGGTALSMLHASLFAATYAWQRTTFVGWTALSGYAVGVVATVGSLLLGMGVAALGAGMLVRGVVVLGMALIHVWRSWVKRGLPRPALCRAEIAAQASITSVLFVSRAAGMIAAHGESAIVAAALGSSAAAVYGITGKVFGVCAMIVNPIAGGAFSGLAHLFAGGDKPRAATVIRELLGLSGVAAGIVVGGAIALNELFVKLWVGDTAFGGFALSCAIGASVLVVTRINLLGQCVGSAGALRTVSVVGLIEVVLRLALIAIALRPLGVIAIPLATVAAAASTGYPLLASRLGDVLGSSFRSSVRLAMHGLLPAIVGVLVGMTCHAALAPGDTWGGLIVDALLVGTIVVAVVGCASGDARGLVAVRFRALRVPRVGPQG
jgi:O-antigen/teichoic acid export membrane protein